MRNMRPSWKSVSEMTALKMPMPCSGVVGCAEVWRCGVRYLFVQPGADAQHVLARAAELGLVVRTGCVLVEALPDVGSNGNGNL